MYLSRLILNARSHNARRWLADCHELHRVIMSGFPSVSSDAARSELGVLYRVERMESPHIPVLVQSRVAPNWTFDSDAVVSVAPPRSLDCLLTDIADGKRYPFRLRANPTRRVHERATHEADPQRDRPVAEKAESKGKRVEVRREEDRLRWLAARGEATGFAILTTRLLPADQDILTAVANQADTLTGRSTRDRSLTFGTALFEGMLEVTDAARFRDAIATGIGPGKAFGCGLLSIAAPKVML